VVHGPGMAHRFSGVPCLGRDNLCMPLAGPSDRARNYTPLRDRATAFPPPWTCSFLLVFTPLPLYCRRRASLYYCSAPSCLASLVQVRYGLSRHYTLEGNCHSLATPFLFFNYVRDGWKNLQPLQIFLPGPFDYLPAAPERTPP
jgi:hypothetical protein